MQVTVYISVTYSLNSIQKLHVVDILDIEWIIDQEGSMFY